MAQRVYCLLVLIFGGIVLLAGLSWLCSWMAGCIQVDRPALIQVNIDGREALLKGVLKRDTTASRPADYQTPAEIIDEVIDGLFPIGTETDCPAPGEP